jgi:hypothetical protein
LFGDFDFPLSFLSFRLLYWSPSTHSHGLTGLPDSYSVICEQLASYGYVVMSIWHGDGSAPINLTESFRASAKHRYVPMQVGWDDPEAWEFRNLQIRIREIEENGAANERDKVTIMMTLLVFFFLTVLISHLQQLHKNDNNMFAGRLLTEKIGVFGHR